MSLKLVYQTWTSEFARISQACQSSRRFMSSLIAWLFRTSFVLVFEICLNFDRFFVTFFSKRCLAWWSTSELGKRASGWWSPESTKSDSELVDEARILFCFFFFKEENFAKNFKENLVQKSILDVVRDLSLLKWAEFRRVFFISLTLHRTALLIG